MIRKESLLKKLEAYSAAETYPFHMPGHKRQTDLGITCFPNPFSVDITEIDGFDDLHCPEGILKEAMEHAAAVYGSDRTYYLVNGSTCGNLSALLGVTHTGGRIVMARNSHKSAYHAVFLNQLDPVFVWPEYLEDYGIQGAAVPEAIEAALKDNVEAEAVFITSPTYEGIVSDVESIANIAHRYNIPLIVDEAHGAHFSFGGGDGGVFPKSALACGADIVIQSLHKTLPSLTQTAVLHIKSGIVRPERIERYLQIFQTSSPSYIFLAAIENCIGFMEREGALRMDEFGMRMTGWMRECKDLKNLQILSDELVGTRHVMGRDLSKVVVFSRNGQLTGMELAELLRSKYHLEPEMSCQRYVLLMTSLMDSLEGLERLKNALFHIDAMIGMEDKLCETKTVLTWVNSPKKQLVLAEAGHVPSECILLSKAAGRVSSGFITVYPPGIPALVPGEVFTGEVIQMILYYAEAGFTVEGIIKEGIAKEEIIKEGIIKEEFTAGGFSKTWKVWAVRT